MNHPIETFADVLHKLVDGEPFSADEKDQAHAVLDVASGQRTPAPEPDPAAEPVADEADAAAVAEPTPTEAAAPAE